MRPENLFNPENAIDVTKLGLETAEAKTKFEFDPTKELTENDWAEIAKEISAHRRIMQRSTRLDDDDDFSFFLNISDIARIDPARAVKYFTSEDWHEATIYIERNMKNLEVHKVVDVMSALLMIDLGHAKNLIPERDVDAVFNFAFADEGEESIQSDQRLAIAIARTMRPDRQTELDKLFYEISVNVDLNIIRTNGNIGELAEYFATTAMAFPKQTATLLTEADWEAMLTEFHTQYATGDPLEYRQLAGALTVIAREFGKLPRTETPEISQSEFPVTKNF